jgi:hypothetical protein
VTESLIPSRVEMQAEMFSRAVLDTSRTRVRTFGSDDAGHLVRALCRQVTLDDPGLAPVVGVIAPQLQITTKGRESSVQELKTRGGIVVTLMGVQESAP